MDFSVTVPKEFMSFVHQHTENGALDHVTVSTVSAAPAVHAYIYQLPRETFVKSTQTIFAAALLSLSLCAQAGVGMWTSAGPRAVWERVAADPRPGGALFIDSRPGRSYRSNDGALHWSPIAVAGLARSELEAYAFDTMTPHRVYAAVDDTGGTGSNSLQIYRSDDDGVSWLPMGKPYATFGLIGTSRIASRIGVSRFDPTHLYALTKGDGVLAKSFDAGQTWSTIGPPGGLVLDFAVSGAASDAIYVASAGGAARTLDGGVTWQLLQNGLSGEDGDAVEVDRNSSARVLLVTRSNGPSTPVQRLYMSNDGGATWKATGISAPRDASLAQIAFDPADASTIVARLSSKLFVSRDGGSTWSTLGLLGGDTATGLGILSTGRIVVATFNHGILTSDDKGRTWLALNNNLPGSPTRKLDAVSAGDFTLFGLTNLQSFGTSVAYRRGSGANLWQMANASGTVLGPVGVGGDNSGLAIARSRGLIQGLADFRSTDAGATWQPLAGAVSSIGGRVDGFTFAVASNSNVVAFGELTPLITTGFTPGTFATSHDGGLTWQDASGFVFPPSVSLVVADPTSPTVFYAGGGQSSGMQIVRSTDSGDHWASLSLVAPQGSTRVSAILVNPGNGRQLVASFAGSNVVYLSNDAGATWAALATIADAASVNALAADWSTTPPMLYAGTEHGVYSVGLSSSVAPWNRVAGSEGLSVNDLRADLGKQTQDRLTLTAATISGVWEYTLDRTSALEAVYRFYNTQTNAHFYTTSASERDHVLSTWPQFHYEGVAFYVAVPSTPGTVSIYRFYNSTTATHFYTASIAERDKIIATLPSFAYEGNVFNGFSGGEPGVVKVYRFYDTRTNAHFYTTQDDERDWVDQNLPQKIDEGIVYYAYPASSQ